MAAIAFNIFGLQGPFHSEKNFSFDMMSRFFYFASRSKKPIIEQYDHQDAFMTRDIRREFKELVKAAGERDRLWMTGYLEAFTDDESAPLASSAITAPISPAIPSAGEPLVSMSSQPVAPAAPTATTNTVVSQLPAQPAGATLQSALVIFGTETGNSKKIASQVQQELKNTGLKTKLVSTSLVKTDELYKSELIVLVCSTHGDGEPPESAKGFHSAMQNLKVPLSSQKFAVLGLGDSSYPAFCQTGKDFDSFFDKAGATRLHPLGECDVDYQETAENWINGLLHALQTDPGKVNTGSAGNLPVNVSNGNHNGNGLTATLTKPQTVTATKGKTLARVRSNYSLTDTRASKEIRHIEFESDTEIDYLPGDSVGIVPANDLSETLEVLHTLRIPGDEVLTWRSEQYSAIDLFQNKLSLRYLPQRVMKAYENLTLKKLPSERLDLISILESFPPNENIDKQRIVDILEPIVPRYYSIASSPEYHGKNEVHITVADVMIETKRRVYRGLCTGNLFHMPENKELEFKIARNDNFRLPDANTDIIMIGPGTGIAPFRSFLFEREAQGHSGKNWLFFGNRNFAHDFLYQTELLDFFASGTLSKINTAFSRDGDRKVYVQHRMLEHAKELYEWLENGSVMYVCGSKHPMSKDVDEALFNIIEKQRRNGRKDAETYFNDLIESGRYKKDVY